MSNAVLQKIMQEVAIIAFGRAGTADEIAWAQTQAGPNGDYEPLKAAVNQYMGTLAAANGTTATVKTAAMNGLGMNLSNSDAASLAAAIDSGSMSWADAFVICIGMTDSHGQTLDNRADAAHSFLASLATAQKSGYFSGEAVNNAVKNLLQGIGTSATSLANGKSGLSDLVSALSAQGIQSAVVDGYVKGATVFVDANGDGVQNEGEWSTTTDNNGNYVLPADIAGGKIVASGGTDIMTGKPFQGVLTAPAGSTVVNPITTLVQALVESGQSTSVEAAVSAVQQSLGLPADVNPLSYDPLAVLGDANASEAAKSAALSVQATALQVANVISQAGAAINAGSTTTTLLSSASAVIEALAGSLAAGTPVNLSNATTLTAIVQTAATSAGVASVGTLSADLAAITAASNTAAAGATSITQLAQTAVVAQGSAVAAITSGVTGGSLAGATSSFTGSALTTQVNQATVGEIAPGVVVPPPTPTTPPPSTGGGGSGGGAPAATFTVTNTAGVVTFGGTATGDITVTVSGANTVFTRGGIAQTVATADITSKITVDSGQTLTGTAAVLTGKTIDGAGTVAVTALHSTDAADLSSITATTVTAAVADHVTFAGKLGEAVVSITGDSTMELDSSAELGTASFVVGRDAELTGSYAQLNGVTVTNGSADTTTEGNTSGDLLIYLSNSDDLSLWNTSGFGDDLDVCVEVTGSVDLSSKDVAKIGAFDVVSGASLTLTAEKASGKEIAGDGSVTITGLTADTDLSGISASGTITGTVTADVNLTAVDLTKLDTLTIATGTTATVSPQQYAVWKGNYEGTLDSTDTTAPTVTTASAAYDEDSNTLTITGANFDTLLESGETASTDIKGRLDWSKLVWDINGDDAVTTNVTFEASDISSAKVTDEETLTIKLTDVKGATLEGTTDYGATNNADTLDIAAGFAVDISDNAATGDNLSNGVITIQADAVAPTASVTTATIGQSGNASVQSTELGTAYLVNTSVAVTDLASITGANTNLWNQATITAAGTPTNLAATGLLEGSYKVYAVDAAGNLSAASTNTVTVDTTPATISAVTIPNAAMNIGDVVTATITVANATGETLMLKAGSTIGGFTLGSLAKTDDTTYTATFTVAAAGTDVAAGSDIPVSLTLVDPAGNESTQFTTAISQNADAIDANAPNAPAALDLAAADDTGVSNSDNLTKNTSALTITGTAEAGSTVVLYDTDGTTELGSGTATGGNFSIDVSLTAGSHSITAKTTDTSGNASVASSALTVKVDATPPSVAASALAYAEASNTITVTATGLASLLETGEDATTDIKARIDWTKLTWDIGSDDTDNVSFTVDDISSAKVTASDTLTIVLASAKATALEGATGFGGNDDYLDVASDFFGDKAGNVQAHEAVTAPITITPAPDETPPNSTITSASFYENGGYLYISGTNFNSTLESGEDSNTDIKGRLDWTKLFWDLNGDNATSGTITFAESDIQQARASSDSSLYVLLTSEKAAAIIASEHYAYRNNEDKLDVTAGFIRDLAGNAATTDGCINGTLGTDYTQMFSNGSSTTVAPTANATYFHVVNTGNAATEYAINGTNITSQFIMFDSGVSTGQTYTLSNLGSTVSNVYIVPFQKATAGNVVVTESSATLFTTGAGSDTLVSSSASQVSFDTGSGNDDLTGGSAADLFKFANADFTADDSIAGGDGEDTLWITGAATITDAQFTNVTSIGSLALDGGQTHSITLGTLASAAFDNTFVTNPINISIMNGETATSITLNAAAATDAISISNKPNSGNAGAMEVTGGSGDDIFIFGDGTATVHFAETAAANGDDNIYIAAANNTVTLDFSTFLMVTSANTTAADFSADGLDLSTGNNLGIVFKHTAMTAFSASDIATSATAGKVAVADNGKAVVLVSDASDAAAAEMAWEIWYIEDTDTSGSQTWAVTMVGQVYADDSGATATEIGTMNFA